MLEKRGKERKKEKGKKGFFVVVFFFLATTTGLANDGARFADGSGKTG